MKGQYRELYRRILAAGMAMGLTFTGTVPAAAANEKEETVYVFTDAEGNETKVIVSDKLKNNEGSDEIEDKSNLENIENVKGDEKYTDNGGGNITWDAQGNTIYYQGDSTQEVPIKVKVTYKLDGREIAPEDLAGKSGRVTIRYEYENTEKVTEKVGDKEEKVSVPFTVLTGLMFTNNKVSNVEVSEGKVINQGDNTFVVGIAFPGLKDSLEQDKYKDLDMDYDNFKDYVEVTMDAEDFALYMSMSVVMNDEFNDLDISEIDDKMDDMNDDIDDLKDAADKLEDGSGDLYDGLKKLDSNMPALSDGSARLSSGIYSYTDGVGSVKDGAAELKDGTSSLADGAKELDTGAAKLNSGARDLAGGAATLSSGTGDLYDGTVKARDGVSRLDDGAQDLMTAHRIFTAA